MAGSLLLPSVHDKASPRKNAENDMHGLVIKTKNWLTICDGNQEPLPLHLTQRMCEQMTFREVKILYGAARYRTNPVSGEREEHPVETKQQRLWYYDRNGLFNCPVGFLTRAWTFLDANGVTLEFSDGDPPDAEKWQPDWDAVHAKLTLRNRQQEALQAILDNFGGLIEAPPGFGKSFLLRALALLLPRIKIAIVTKQAANVEGLVKDISQSVMCGQQGIGEHTRHRVTVYSADSMHYYDASADLMIGDEAHQLLATQYTEQIAQLFECRRIALTATPKGRGDNSDLRMEAIFGPHIFKMTWQEAVARGLIVNLHVQWHSVVMAENPCAAYHDPMSRARYGIWQNQVRNQIIADVANAHADEQVLILVEKVEHAVYLGHLLPDYTLVYRTMKSEALLDYQNQGLLPFDYVPPTAADLRHYRDEFVAQRLRKVIATDVWSTGVSFDHLRVLIRADATANEIRDTQLPGRTSRIDGVKTEGVLHDFLDQFDGTYRGRAKFRGKNYKAKDWRQSFPPGLYRPPGLCSED